MKQGKRVKSKKERIETLFNQLEDVLRECHEKVDVLHLAHIQQKIQQNSK